MIWQTSTGRQSGRVCQFRKTKSSVYQLTDKVDVFVSKQTIFKKLWVFLQLPISTSNSIIFTKTSMSWKVFHLMFIAFTYYDGLNRIFVSNKGISLSLSASISCSLSVFPRPFILSHFFSVRLSLFSSLSVCPSLYVRLTLCLFPPFFKASLYKLILLLSSTNSYWNTKNLRCFGKASILFFSCLTISREEMGKEHWN